MNTTHLDRRRFLTLTSAGLATAMLPGGAWSVETGGLFRKKVFDFRVVIRCGDIRMEVIEQ